MLTWEIVTEKLEAEAREAETGRRHRRRQPAAAGAGPGRGRTARSITVGPRDDPRGVRLDLRVVLGGRPRRAGPAVRRRLGHGRRGVPPRHAGGAVPRGRGAATARPGRPRDLVFVDRPGRDRTSCSRAAAARRAGLKSARLPPDPARRRGRRRHGLLQPSRRSSPPSTGSRRLGTWAGWSPTALERVDQQARDRRRPRRTSRRKVNQLMKVAQAAAAGRPDGRGRGPGRRRHGPARRGAWPR